MCEEQGRALPLDPLTFVPSPSQLEDLDPLTRHLNDWYFTLEFTKVLDKVAPSSINQSEIDIKIGRHPARFHPF